ncbi:drug resistance transporter, EmrB/QacA subfamily protein [Alkalihalophilus pseudofirmus OF4]|uniref:Drug resistance transporter, EmrB/QacA subfamily protein n=1 Tax=Alkalihalophilus pseudofirmus (strain ATCC BAA-2126 / JCM 17055 / OF4) TaxID=398511 RepID=D3FXB9_ALKPO|nr:drug resistance transporter, EmrB/QacA subfamily protein [Alkalihalophilus pseudofirmus OF4]
MSKRKTKRPIVLTAVILAMFMAAVEATIVATAMPQIVADLGGFSLFSWVFSSYLLMQVVMIPVYGKLSDMYGRKIIFAIGISIFLIGSILCGFSATMEMLIISRFIQGLGAGAVQPIATTIVGDMYTKEERANIQGYLASVWGISAIMGPVLGAVFIEYLHWAWIFWVNIPFGIIALIGVTLFLHEDIKSAESMKKNRQSIDYKGALLLLLAITPFMLVLIQGNVWGFTSPLVMSLLACSFICLVLFIKVERREANPMMTLSLWENQHIRNANIASFTAGAILLAVSTFLPTYVQGVMNQPPIIAGLALTAISIGWPISSTIAGKMMLKKGFRTTALIGGCALVTGGLFYMLLPVINHPLWAGAGSFVIGVGMGFSTTTFIVSIQSSVDWNVRGEATSMNMFMRLLGGAVGVAFLGGLLNRRLENELKNSQEYLSFEPTIDAVNHLLEAGQREELRSVELEALQLGLTNSLGIVFTTIFILAVTSFFFILRLPKDS